jgi:hypothetical protein
MSPASSYMRSRRCSGPGRPSGDTKASGRRVTRKAPLAHVAGGSGRSEASPTAILKDTHSVEGVSVLKNSFALSSASEPGAENAVFVVFWPCFVPLWTADRADNDFFNTLSSKDPR